ncbi:3-oxo-tetronate kinase [Homoserinimonas hongtaonis]|uniref:3-oxo-tetronate kinase n=1 Tax=Homoserinimonas hongtaonis TaxID=2079791 RepID=UPI000D391CD5|nr:3-oxo-tetronate kinase [Salinibacterium hongtaonis]AWB89525.1 hypothetical protein C2138_08195 [Salinibacterium hongtaonis]
MAPWLGVIADDYTGATDLAGMLVRSGTSAVQFFGVPTDDMVVPEADCLVVALKSRSIDAADAVEQSLEAARWLLAQGVEQLFFKYCSTFDSTAAGNIGPVAEALHREIGSGIAVIAPAVPENGRTVYQGRLFVGEKPLDESPMRNHPLNPMTDSDLGRLFSAQSSLTTGLVSLSTVRSGADAVRQRLTALEADGISFAVVDTVADEDLIAIGAAIVDAKLVTGAAGMAVGLAAARAAATGQSSAPAPALPVGAAAVLSGSCSTATQGQVALYSQDHPSFLIDPLRLAAGDDVVGEALAFARDNLDSVPLIYSSADPAQVAAVQAELGVSRSAGLIEDAFASIARGLVESGVRRLIVAGGETSGAVVVGLGTSAIQIGEEVDPGVPWTISVDEPQIGLLLKSGNFGAPDIFTKALEGR